MLAQRYRDAVADSRLSALPEATLTALTAGSTVLDVPSGGVLLRLGSTDPFLCLVATGLVRTFLVSVDGRQMTVRYSRRGDIVGAATVFAGQLANTGVQAIVDSSVLVLRPQSVRDLAATDLGFANVLLHDLAERATAYISALASTTLSSLRQNVIRHLLDLAEPDPGGNGPVVRLSQQALAEHVGTVREVIGRILRDLKDQGLLATRRDEIVLLDAARLHELTWPRVT
jgi:CRP/FNR family cyclic AMP-dependent transcriptional regulator